MNGNSNGSRNGSGGADAPMTLPTRMLKSVRDVGHCGLWSLCAALSPACQRHCAGLDGRHGWAYLLKKKLWLAWTKM